MFKETINTRQLKDELLSVLKSEHPTMCRRWFNEIRVLGVVDGSLVVQIDEPVQLKYLQRCCVDQFVDAAQTVTKKLLGVRFVGEEGLGSSGDSSVVVMGDVHFGNSDNILNQSIYLHNELPIRLAHRTKELSSLPEKIRY